MRWWLSIPPELVSCSLVTWIGRLFIPGMGVRSSGVSFKSGPVFFSILASFWLDTSSSSLSLHEDLGLLDGVEVPVGGKLAPPLAGFLVVGENAS